MVRHSTVVEADEGLANALRRALLADLEAWAPCELTIVRNTSCHTDEYVAHRIGLVPFRRAGAGDTMALKRKGGVAMASDLAGSAFEAVVPDLPIVDLGRDAEVELTVRFDQQSASKHARYSTCAAVGMQKVGARRHKISFELHDDRARPADVFLRAIRSLEARVDDCLLQLARQPDPPPRSMCG